MPGAQPGGDGWAQMELMHYYFTNMSFYHIRSRKRAKYEAVIHCSVLL